MVQCDVFDLEAAENHKTLLHVGVALSQCSQAPAGGWPSVYCFVSRRIKL